MGNALAVEHPYYCAERAYHVPANASRDEFGSWEEFAESAWASSDIEANLLFRWDWLPADDPEDFDEGDMDGPRGEHLDLFFMLQRKGLFVSVTVDVVEGDAPAVREWLQVRWEHLRLLWAPVSGEA